MLERLDDKEARVIGCLIEKSITTPDQYPLTLNALTTACNQKSSRNPIMSLSQGEVQHTVRTLESRHLVRTEENFRRQTEKYSQRLCNTRYSDLQLDPAEVAVVCLLLLRGPQTPGELRSRSGRLYTFADNAAVVVTLDGLINRESGSVVVKLPRTPGRKDAEYTHLFGGPVDVDAHIAKAVAETSAAPRRDGLSELRERVDRLESELAELRTRLGVTAGD